jgi:hypothetical protein
MEPGRGMTVINMSPRRLEKRHPANGCLFYGQIFGGFDLSLLDSFAFRVGTGVALTVALQKENGGAA